MLDNNILEPLILSKSLYNKRRRRKLTVAFNILQEEKTVLVVLWQCLDGTAGKTEYKLYWLQNVIQINLFVLENKSVTN